MDKLGPSPNLPRVPFPLAMRTLAFYETNLNTSLVSELSTLRRSINNLIGHPSLPDYTVDTLPEAASFPAGIVYVSDESGGAQPAFSDGTDWRRFTDRAVVS